MPRQAVRINQVMEVVLQSGEVVEERTAVGVDVVNAVAVVEAVVHGQMVDRAAVARAVMLCHAGVTGLFPRSPKSRPGCQGNSRQ